MAKNEFNHIYCYQTREQHGRMPHVFIYNILSREVKRRYYHDNFPVDLFEESNDGEMQEI